jgi:signal transduction histidine kinase
VKYERFLATGRVLSTDVVPALVAIGILAGGSTGASRHLAESRTPLDALAYTILVVAGAAFVLRRHAPVALLAIDSIGAAVYLGRAYAYGPILVAVAISAFIAATRVRRDVAVIAGAASGIALVTGDFVGASQSSFTGVLGSLALFGWPAIPTVLGNLVAVARDARRTAEQESQRRETDEERLRLAREVHDVVGHGLSVISLQSGVALHLLDRKPEEARAALEAIRRASTEALDELRTTLALARDEDARRTPLSGLARLPGLITEVRLCGLRVDVTVEGAAETALPQHVDQTAFRIVQEGLTNALRHSGASHAGVVLRHDASAVQIIVDDNGTMVSSSPRADGHGLKGLQERASEVGGWCRAGPRAEGGWRLEAWLPLGATDSKATEAARR